jgi:hypothetical protein
VPLAVCCPADDAETVIELMPSSPDGYYHKGFALFQLHDYAGAVSSLLTWPMRHGMALHATQGRVENHCSE